MYKKCILLCIGLLFALVFAYPLHAQNLVSNPGFEDYYQCPTGISGIDFTSSPTVKDWLSAAASTTPDYCNSCAAPNSGVHVPEVTFGHQPAHGGNAYAGIILWEERNSGLRFGEYVQTKLSTPMIAGRKYCVTFFVNPTITAALAYNYMAVDEVGAHFSPTRISSSGNSLSVPYHVKNKPGNYLTDTATWIKVTDIYTAAGGEQWITIGRFDNTGTKPTHIQAYPPTPNASLDYRSYVYIDDVSVYMITPADTFYRKFDSVYCDRAKLPMTLESTLTDANYEWSTGASTQQVTVTADGTYWCKTVAGCAVYIDTFFVKYIAESKLDLGKELIDCNNQPVTIIPNIQYGSFSWSTGAVTPQITVNNPGTYWLKVTNACGSYIDTVRIYIQGPTPAPVVRDTILCQLTMAPILRNASGQNLHWYTDAQSKIGSPVQPFVYTKDVDKTILYVTQKIGKCESEKVPMNIDIRYQPKKELDNNSEMCSYNPIFIGKEYPGVKYLWSNGSTACCVKPTREGLFKVSVSNECGLYIDSTRVKFLPCDKCIHVPNAFTPNGDGVNDKFVVIQDCPIKSYHIRIFNRWGEQVFEARDVRQQWTGTETGLFAEQGTYIYIIEYTAESNNVPIILKGTISLLK
ncbi:MAG: gliding motility-associated C-terminal domain-containing protein [Flavipsychrobacter sp.]|nr:gliding motility-associated C-terminal domain-containing protein [Flavipsychrobacter sp.]